MNRNLLVLVALAVVALLGGWYFGSGSVPVDRTSIDAGQLMFPDMTAKLATAQKIEIVFQGKTTTIALKNGRWGVADRGGFPAQDSKIHALMTALTELRLVEARTADPADFARLGVEDPSKPDANSQLLRVLGEYDSPILAVIAGHRRTRTQGKQEDEIYVRRPDENQSWLAQGALQVEHDPGQWLDRDVVNIAATRLVSVTITRGDQKLVLTREAEKLTLSDPKEHPKLEDYKLEDIGRGLAGLTFQDVRAAGEPIGTLLGKSVFVTNDGLTIEATVFKADKDIWVGLTATSADDKTKAETETLSKKFAGWLFQVGAWKEAALVPRMEDLKAAEPPPPPALPPGLVPPPPAPPAPNEPPKP